MTPCPSAAIVVGMMTCPRTNLKVNSDAMDRTGHKGEKTWVIGDM